MLAPLFASELASSPWSSSDDSPAETFLGGLYIRDCPVASRATKVPLLFDLKENGRSNDIYCFIIEMSSIASTLVRRDTGLGSAEIGYDEERAEPHSRACNGNNSSWMPSCHSPVLYSGANSCSVDSISLLLLRRWISYLSFTCKSRSSTIGSPQQVQYNQTQRLVQRSRSFHLLPS